MKHKQAVIHKNLPEDFGFLHCMWYTSYLLLCNKLLQNLKQNIFIILYFYSSEIQAQLTWVFSYKVSHKAISKVSDMAQQRKGKISLIYKVVSHV
jgi:hypothetical protein